MISNEAPRPLNLGEILDRTVQLYRDQFLVYLGIAIIPTGLLLIFGGAIFLGFAWFGSGPPSSSARLFNVPAATVLVMLFMALAALVALPVMLGVSSLSTAAMNCAAAGALAGQRPTIRGSFAEAWRRGWQYVWLYLLQALMVWGAPLIVWFGAVMGITLVTIGVGRGAAGQAAGALMALMTFAGLAALAGYAIWMLRCVGLAFPGCVVEKISAWKALRRSFRLSKGTRGRIFVLYLLGAVLGWISSLVVVVIFAIAVALIPGMNSPQKAQTMGLAMIFLVYGSSFAVQACFKPVYAIALMLFYYDQRIRNEGFDIEWMMERAGLTAGVGVSREFGPMGSAGTASVPAEFETTLKDDAFDGARGLVPMEATKSLEVVKATEPTKPTQLSETAEIANATQPENEVQQ